MLEVHAFSTPNSVKVTITLEELALDYTLHPVNIRAGGRKTPEFTALNPNANRCSWIPKRLSRREDR
jgi:GST-like protein